MAVFERMPEINRVMENPFGHGALELKNAGVSGVNWEKKAMIK